MDAGTTLVEIRLGGILARLGASPYVAAIVAAEVLTAFVDVLTGVVFHAVIALALVTHATLRAEGGAPYGGRLSATVSTRQAAYAALSLVPLLRIVSVTMPFGGVHRVYQFALVGVPILVGTISAARLLPQVALSRLFHPRGTWMTQASIGALGVPLAVAAYMIERPEPLVGTGDLARFALGIVAVAVFVGLGEELLFRGVLQTALNGIFLRGGYLVSSALFAAAYLAAGSVVYVAFAATFGVVFAWLVERTRSLVGVVIAHALMAVGALVVCPVVIA